MTASGKIEMKFVAGVFLLLLLPGLALAGPLLVMPSEKVTYGVQVVSGDTVQVSFPLSNNGDGDLTIVKVVPDCGCAAAYFDQVIAPGGRGRIDLVIDTAGLSGRIRKRAMVRTNDPQKKGFMIEAELDVIPANSGT